MKRFEIGQKYGWVCWFTGGLTTYTVVSRSEKSVTLDTIDVEIDGVHHRKETFNIEKGESGNERILIQQYHGEKGYIEAK